MNRFSRIAHAIASALRSFFDIEGAASTRFWGYGGRTAINRDSVPDVGDRLFGNRTEDWMLHGKNRFSTSDTPK